MSGVSADLVFRDGAGDGNRTRTVSLGTGLSCLVDHGVAGQAASEVVRGYPSGTAPDSVVGHAAGTPPGRRQTHRPLPYQGNPGEAQTFSELRLARDYPPSHVRRRALTSRGVVTQLVTRIFTALPSDGGWVCGSGGG
jgi:hypothetical protein